MACQHVYLKWDNVSPTAHKHANLANKKKILLKKKKKNSKITLVLGPGYTKKSLGHRVAYPTLKKL